MKYDLKLKAIFQDAMPGMVVRLVNGWILHLELQSKNDAAIVDRCLDYRVVIRRKWPGARIRQVVIFMGSERLTMQSAIDEDDLQFRFALVNLQDVPASTFLFIGKQERARLGRLVRQ